jgi:hypothetical protein
MRKGVIFMPLAAFVAGVAGFFIRRSELNTVFNDGTGLAERNAPVSVILIALSVAAFIAFALISYFTASKYKAVNDYVHAFSPAGFSYLAIFFVLGFCWLASDIMYFLDIQSERMFSAIDIIFVVMSALSAVSIMFLARAAYRRREGAELLLFGVIPSVFLCFWLILLYKQNAANPVLLEYSYQTLAISAAALSFYFSAGFVFKKAAAGKQLLSMLLTVYFGMVVLADNTGIPLKVMFAVLIVSQLVNMAVFLKNLKSKYQTA